MTATAAPFADGAWIYRKAGWAGVIPIGRAGRRMWFSSRRQEWVIGDGKFPPQPGYTGWTGIDPSGPDLQEWCKGVEAQDNLGLHLPRDVYALDVDAYGDKHGDATLAALVEKCGPLPATWTSTSRGPGQAARIHLFRAELPEGRMWIDHPGGQGGGLDSIHAGHRYVVTWPSVHPKTGAVYQWYRPDGTPSPTPPSPSDLAKLPAAWIETCTKPGERLEGGSASTEAAIEAVRQFADGPACPVVQKSLDTELARIESSDKNGLHASGPVYELVCLGIEGHHGARQALSLHHDAFVTARVELRGGTRSTAEAEWWRMLCGAVGKKMTATGGELLDLCDCWNTPNTPDGDLGGVEGELAGDAEDDAAPSWAEVDLLAYVNGEYEAPRPDLMPRRDGACLLYRGLVHSIHGESESGKSWIAQCEVARVIRGGGLAGYIDFESDPASVVGRLLELGCTAEQIVAGLSYRRPESSPHAAREREAWNAMLGNPRDIVIIDGVTDSLGLWGASSTDNDEVAGWLREFPRRLARRTGAAVVLIDHVVKNTDARGRFAMGAQSKMAGLDGAAYTVDVVEPLGRGLRGVLSMRVAKDRPGGVRGIAGEMKKGDRTQEVALFVLDGTGEALSASLDVPDGARKAFRPTHLMERISIYVESNPGCPKSAIERDVTGNKPAKSTALGLLISEGWVKVEPDGKALRLHCMTAYREPSPLDSPMSPNVPHNSPMGEAPPMSPNSPTPLLRGGVGDGGVGPTSRRRTSPTRCSCPNAPHGHHHPDCPRAGAA